jgi:Pyruvate/2-oxoacid:ferredoxin oxidoreductase delta subunit
MLKFFARFPKGTNKVFFLNTRAGMKLSKIHTPGLGGIALWLPMLIMIFKGYKPVGFRPIDMPSNWISLHPGLRAKVVQSIKERCTQTLERFTKKILNGKPVLNGLLWLPLDIAVVPISVLYYFLGRFAIAKTFYANYSCNSCRLCINQCPVGAIVEKSGRPYWTFRCESCMKCMNSCPKRAIETAHGYSFLIWWAAFSFFPSLLFRLLFEAKVITPEVYNQYHFLLHYGSMILAGFIVIFFGYKILHQLLRMKLLNRIITYTSLTHYKFWRRYFLH